MQLVRPIIVRMLLLFNIIETDAPSFGLSVNSLTVSLFRIDHLILGPSSSALVKLDFIGPRKILHPNQLKLMNEHSTFTGRSIIG